MRKDGKERPRINGQRAVRSNVKESVKRLDKGGRNMVKSSVKGSRKGTA